jgi:hypothetical protein
MKRLVLILAVMSLILSVTLAFAEDEKIADPVSPAKSNTMQFDKEDFKATKDMIMQCSQQDIKAILKQILELQLSSLDANYKKKAQIKQKILALIKKIDAMPDKMDCLMMNMKHDSFSDQKEPANNQTKDETKPAEHKH